jgi:AraC family transcriptional regulator of adaptative response / DNA-3-methyladenine glycosylase II
MTSVTRRLSARAPFDARSLLAFLGRRVVAGIEDWDPATHTYRRSLRLPRGAGVVELRPDRAGVHARLRLDDRDDLEPALACCRRLLDLDADPGAVTTALGSDALIGALVRETPGLRVPGHTDPFELAIRAVLGQQVSVTGAGTLAGRLVAAHGEPLADPVGGVTHTFPPAAALAQVDPATLAMPGSRRRALIGLSEAIAAGDVVLDPDGDRGLTQERLLALPGIGPWTVSYIAMRALGDRDAFLPSDLGVRRALERLGQDGSPRAAAKAAEAWRPYRAYALQYLWR